MKSFDHVRICRAEIAQLIVLETLFSLKESRKVIFQGGTALRWFYGGVRFSEDLDFVTPLTPGDVGTLVHAAAPQIRRLMTANFGEGTFTVHPKKGREGAYKAFVDFAPAGVRGKVRVKVEFEQLAAGMAPEFRPVIMQSAPAVSYFIREAGFRTAGGSVIANVETPEEILTDKLRALMERPYTKGRDFFDVWFLTTTLNLRPDVSGLANKLKMYAAPFTLRTPAAIYAAMDRLDEKTRSALNGDLQRDLARFLDAETLTLLEAGGFEDLLGAVQGAFAAVATPLSLKTDHGP